MQTFDVPFGAAHVFYPEAGDERCSAALLLDIDPIGLVGRGRGASGFALAEYVNDRPYVASSFLAVALASARVRVRRRRVGERAGRSAAVNVRLLTPDLALLDAALAGRAALARALDHDVAEGWEVFGQSVVRARDAVALDPGGTRWGTRFFVCGDPPTLVGWGGFKGPPQEGAVEIGYAVAPGWRGRGVASAAVRALLREAWAAPGVEAVLAHTLAEPNASVRVLEKAGFAKDGERSDANVGALWRWRLQRPGGSATAQSAVS